MTTTKSIRWWLGVIAVCWLASCSQNKPAIKHVSDGGTGGSASGGNTGNGGAGGELLVDAAGTGGALDAAWGNGGSTGMGGNSGGTVGTGGTDSATTKQCPMEKPCNWCGGSKVYDNAGCVSGYRCANGADPCITSSCGITNPCAAGYTCETDRLCWPSGTGGVGGAIGAGGTGGSTCPPVANCNWCGGQTVKDSAGCVTGFRCANGADPCKTNPCTGSGCPTGYTCNSQLCWPAGGAGGGGATGSGGTGGIGGMTGTGQPGVRCLNALCNTGQVCCVSQSSSTLTCTSQTGCAGDFAVTCDGPEDCGGRQCCGPSGAIIQTTCASGSCLAGLAMCHNSADCPSGENCCPTITFGYSHGYCQTGACRP